MGEPLTAAAVDAWVADPDPAAAVRLCATVGADLPPAERYLALRLGREIRGLCAENVGALLGAARMYILLSALGEAQSTLLAASLLAPHEHRTFALLGQVLLRTGDARRAVQAFDRAKELGMKGPATLALAERAAELVTLQDAEGEDAVAERVEHDLSKPSEPPRPNDINGSDRPTWSGEDARREATPPPYVHAQTLVGVGAAPGPVGDVEPPHPPHQDEDIERILAAFVDPAPPQSEPAPARPLPGAAPTPPPPRVEVLATTPEVVPVTRYSVIHHETRSQAPTKPRTARPEISPSGHRDFSIETWELDEPHVVMPSSPTPARQPPAAVATDEGRNAALEEDGPGAVGKDDDRPADAGWYAALERDQGRRATERDQGRRAAVDRRAITEKSLPAAARRAAAYAPTPPLGVPVATLPSEELVPTARREDALDAGAPAAEAARSSGPRVESAAPARSLATTPPRTGAAASDEAPLSGPISSRVTRPADVETTALTAPTPAPTARAASPSPGPAEPAAARTPSPSPPPPSPVPARPSSPPPSPAPPARAHAETEPSSQPTPELRSSRPPSHRPSERPRARTPRWVVPVVGAVLTVLALHTGRWLERNERSRNAGMRLRDARVALHTAGSRGLADAEAEIARARETDPTSREVAVAAAQVRAMRVLDDGAPPSSLVDAIARARALGADDAELASVDLVAAVVDKNAARIDALLARPENERKDLGAQALYELTAGVALEQRGDARAIERYQAAVRADPDLFSAEQRLIRALLLYGDAADGRRHARALPSTRPEAVVLTALAQLTATVKSPGAAVLPADDMLPTPLRSVARALTLRTQPPSASRVAGFAAAIGAADAPAVAVFCGRLALELGDVTSAEFGAKRALDVATSYPPGLTLTARTALVRHDLRIVREIADKLGGSAGAEIAAMAAYEDLDAAQMAAAVARVAPPPPEGAPIRVALDRLRGERVAQDRLQAAADADPIWGVAVAHDGALDRGDHEGARDLEKTALDGARPALWALRAARRARVEGRLDEAKRTLDTVPANGAAIFERALLAAEMRSERAAALEKLGTQSGPTAAWMSAYLVARQGVVDKALKMVSSLELPGADAPRATRIAASLALSELAADGRGRDATRRLLEAWPHDLDILRAAVGFELVRKSSLRATR